jgi:hypothetical protein
MVSVFRRITVRDWIFIGNIRIIAGLANLLTVMLNVIFIFTKYYFMNITDILCQDLAILFHVILETKIKLLRQKL